jgi:hypothetical protein
MAAAECFKLCHRSSFSEVELFALVRLRERERERDSVPS